MPEFAPVIKPTLPTVSDIVPAAQEPPAASEPKTPEIPEAVLEIPTISGLLHGAPPAVYAEKTRQDPEIQTVVKNSKALIDSGFGFYPSKDGKITVLYNGAFISPDELKKADDSGKLTELVPSFDDVQAKFNSAISGEAPEPGAALPGIPVAPAAGGAPPSSRVQNTLATARVKNLQVGSPTSGPKPGAGRILNNILSPTV